MVRIYKELNKLEQAGLRAILKADGWSHCTLTAPGGKARAAMTKKIGEKDISVEIEHFHVDED